MRTGEDSQSATSACEALVKCRTDQMNHSVRGTSAIEVRRCPHQCFDPDRAEPKPRARPKGERSMSTWGVLEMSGMAFLYQFTRPTIQISTVSTPVAISTASPDFSYSFS